MLKYAAKWSHSCSVRNITLKCVLKSWGQHSFHELENQPGVSWRLWAALSVLKEPFGNERRAVAEASHIWANWHSRKRVKIDFLRSNFISLFFHVFQSLSRFKRKESEVLLLSLSLNYQVSLQMTRLRFSQANLWMDFVYILGLSIFSPLTFFSIQSSLLYILW